MPMTVQKTRWAKPTVTICEGTPALNVSAEASTDHVGEMWSASGPGYLVACDPGPPGPISAPAHSAICPGYMVDCEDCRNPVCELWHWRVVGLDKGDKGEPAV